MGGQLGRGMADGQDGAGGLGETKTKMHIQIVQQSEAERSLKTSGPAPRDVKGWPAWDPQLITKGL